MVTGFVEVCICVFRVSHCYEDQIIYNGKNDDLLLLSKKRGYSFIGFRGTPFPCNIITLPAITQPLHFAPVIPTVFAPVFHLTFSSL
jgi:hypothetical protein